MSTKGHARSTRGPLTIIQGPLSPTKRYTRPTQGYPGPTQDLPGLTWIFLSQTRPSHVNIGPFQGDMETCQGIIEPGQVNKGPSQAPTLPCQLNTGPSNGGAQRRRFFAYLLIHQFRILPENFCPRSSQVRSPGQVK